MNQAGTDRAPTEVKTPAMPVIELRCPACGKPGPDGPLEKSHEAGLYSCPGCDLQFWYPAKMPGADWYEATYRGRDTKAMPLEPGHLFFLDDPHAPKIGRLLDIGCGNGSFLAAARDAGFEVTGFEPDHNAVRFAQSNYGLKNVFASVPEEFRREHPDEIFDVVTFFEVLEHQEDPQKFLDTAKSFLAANGYVALSVPNRTRWQVGMDPLDYPPNHLTRWSPKALRNFTERNGFEVISIRQQPLTTRRAAQMLSGLLTTGMVSRVAGEKPLVLADFAEMPVDTIQQKMDRLANDPRHGLAMRLAGWKSRLMMPVAVFLLPFLRRRGFTGLYLYCLLRRRLSPAVAPSGNQSPTRRDVRA